MATGIQLPGKQQRRAYMFEQQVSRKSRAVHRYFRRLRDDVPVEYCIEACQPVHSRYSNCRQCERSCPVNALQLGEGGIDVAASCLGCGQCAVACPTGALGTPGFALPDIVQTPEVPVFVDCWKVPVEHSPKGAVRVPCLGGLSLSRLVELRVAAKTSPIALLDRGWCETCAAGSGRTHPSLRCMDAARELLQAMRIPETQWPVIESRPLPAPQTPSVKTDRSSEQRVSRRAFFGDLAARVTNTATELNPLTSGKQPAAARGHERVPARSRERDRLLAQLRLLSESTGNAMPASIYPAVHIDPQRCNHHQLCAVTCPTGALQVFKTSGVSGVVFDSSGCIACGHCETICPDKAVRLLAQGDGYVPAGPKVLIRIRQRECLGCGSSFEGAAEDTHCPSCSKRTGLAGAAFQVLFGRLN